LNIINSNLQFKSNLSYGNKPDTIVLHHAEASHCTIQDIHSWHLANGWAGCGYHYLVRKDGSIYTGRPENAIGAHCPSENTHSIGICAEGEYMKEQMPQAQKQALIELDIYIKNKYGIRRVGGHKEFYSTDCPGTNYPLSEIKNAILGGNIQSFNNSVIQSQPSSNTWNGYNMDKVRKVQNLVNGLGIAHIDTDGKLGSASLSAFKKLPVAKYNNYHNDAETDVICQLLAIPTPQGYYYNRYVEGKVIEIQKAHRLSADGEVGINTLLELLR
jgi:hypothetical protein